MLPGRTLLRKPQNVTPERPLNGPCAAERTCILSRRTGSRDDLIRLALGPDGQVAPDVRARADGRGAWIGVGRAALDQAQAKGKLKGALARAFKTGDLVVPDGLGERIEAALRQAALDRLGLEARGGKVHLIVHASDAGEDGRKKLDAAWRVGGAQDRGFSRGLIFPLPRPILSMALGRENVVHVALTDAAAARRVANAISRWQAFIDPDAGLDGAAAAGPGSLDDDEGNA